MSGLRAAGAVFSRDLKLFWSGGGGAAAPLGFFIGATTLVPLAVGAERALLMRIGPPLLWVMAALAALMTLERLFQADLEDGSLDQTLLSASPFELIVFAKGAAAFVAVGVPMVLIAAPLAIAMQTPLYAVPMVMGGLAIGMLGFFGIGLMGAALSAGVRRAGLLIAILVLPFYAPFVIFGAAAAVEAANGVPFPPALSMLAGCALGAAVLGPIAAAAAARLQTE